MILNIIIPAITYHDDDKNVMHNDNHTKKTIIPCKYTIRYGTLVYDIMKYYSLKQFVVHQTR